MNAHLSEAIVEPPIAPVVLQKTPADYGNGRPLNEILEDVYWRGFKHGFQKVSPRAATNYEEIHQKYFEGFDAGKKHREQVEEVAAWRGIAHANQDNVVNMVMQLSWNAFYAQEYEKQKLEYDFLTR